jgi:hypothetical protein
VGFRTLEGGALTANKTHIKYIVNITIRHTFLRSDLIEIIVYT